jgi:hypothetical protein
VPNTNPVVLDARGEAAVFWSGAYKVVLKTATDATVWTVDGVQSTDAQGAGQFAADALRTDLASTAAGKGAALVGQTDGAAYPAGTVGWYINKIKPVVTNGVDDYSRIMTELANTDVCWIDGDLTTSQTIVVPEYKGIYGTHRDGTTLTYTGAGACGIYCGQAGYAVPLRGYELRDFTLAVTNKSVVIDGIVMENAIHFQVRDITITGPKNPNLVEPLTGSGLHIKNGSFIGRVSRVDSRLWEYGVHTQTMITGQDSWTAALVFDGQGELINNRIGMMLGDDSVALYDFNGCTVRDYTVEGNYEGGIQVVSAVSATLDNIYCEHNGYWDIRLGSDGIAPGPIKTRINNCKADSNDTQSTPYGSRTYLSKLWIQKASFASARDNDFAAGSIPCIRIDPGSDRAYLDNNRVNTASAIKILDNGVGTIIDNTPGVLQSVISVPTLLNSWANLGSGYEQAGITSQRQANGATEIMLNGMISGGAAGSTIFTLPAGQRPSARIDFAVGGGAANNVAVFSTGDVICTVKGSSSISLRGVRFLV